MALRLCSVMGCISKLPIFSQLKYPGGIPFLGLTTENWPLLNFLSILSAFIRRKSQLDSGCSPGLFRCINYSSIEDCQILVSSITSHSIPLSIATEWFYEVSYEASFCQVWLVPVLRVVDAGWEDVCLEIWLCSAIHNPTDINPP